MSNKAFGWLVALLVIGALVVVAGISNGWFGGRGGQVAKSTLNSSQSNSQPTIDPNLPRGSGYVKAGGIWRPAIDVERQSEEGSTPYASLPSNGSTSGVPFETNKATQMIKEALDSNDEKLISRLSVMHEAKPFDRLAFEKDPQPYLEEVEPGRIWQSAPEGAGTQPIGRLGDFYRQLLQGESAPLSVRTEPFMPATFYSSMLGRFENQLTCITVKANNEGIATVTYTAVPGSHDEVTLIAASPAVSG